MKCPLCGNEMSEGSELVGPYKIFQPDTQGNGGSGQIEICGRCFLLVCILEELKKLTHLVSS